VFFFFVTLEEEKDWFIRPFNHYISWWENFGEGGGRNKLQLPQAPRNPHYFFCGFYAVAGVVPPTFQEKGENVLVDNNQSNSIVSLAHKNPGGGGGFFVPPMREGEENLYPFSIEILQGSNRREGWWFLFPGFGKRRGGEKKGGFPKINRHFKKIPYQRRAAIRIKPNTKTRPEFMSLGFPL